MTSKRRQKKELERAGLDAAEYRMLALLEEVIERFRWVQILGYTCNFLLRERLKIPDDERDRILKAAAAAVEKDGTLKEWQDRVAQLKQDIVQNRRDVKRELVQARKAKPQGKHLQPPDRTELGA